MNRDVIIACDFKSANECMDFLGVFTAQKPFVKIGMELYYAEGPQIVRTLKSHGHRVFLDLKLHDIPHTVAKAMRVLASLNVDMTNLHAAGGSEMMSSARAALDEGGAPSCALLAVTQLTSTSEARMRSELLIERPIADVVCSYAANARASGLQGVVCSPLEAAMVKSTCGAGFLTVTPGIRYPSSDADDQSRVTTPAKAREIGTDFIVVGRPITANADPLAAYGRIKKEFLGMEAI